MMVSDMEKKPPSFVSFLEDAPFWISSSQNDLMNCAGEFFWLKGKELRGIESVACAICVRGDGYYTTLLVATLSILSRRELHVARNWALFADSW
jgi:hypothetical protein